MNEVLNHYEINEKTLALLPAAHIDYATIVLEGDKTFHISQTPLQLIKTACLEAGASYDGRRKAVMYQTGSKRKTPIPINPGKHIYAFPTQSPSLFSCAWIFYHHILSIKPLANKPTEKSMIIFDNGIKLPLQESHFVLENQRQRTALAASQLTYKLQSDYPSFIQTILKPNYQF
ncbi:competence protein ComK [Sediminibacillus massiliensis]|uniref:competence protein ComK n=1 Tax=Sediminibacillus massiliensis TaxID=1926277 RepID=UPI000988785C|nr:competence protein ComK [Sediminibacillus massiliensis]